MIKLCYKSYDWKISNGACRSFKEKTGKDLMGVFAAYIVASINLKNDISTFERCEVFRDVHEAVDDGDVAFDIASKALHCVISASDTSISLEEIVDAMYRVSWTVSDRPDDLSEPWPVVMLDVALQLNTYMCENLPLKKKADS